MYITYNQKIKSKIHLKRFPNLFFENNVSNVQKQSYYFNNHRKITNIKTQIILRHKLEIDFAKFLNKKLDKPKLA